MDDKDIFENNLTIETDETIEDPNSLDEAFSEREETSESSSSDTVQEGLGESSFVPENNAEIEEKEVSKEEEKHAYYEEHLKRESEKGNDSITKSNTNLKIICIVLALALVCSLGALIFQKIPNETKSDNVTLSYSDRVNNVTVDKVHSDGTVYTASEVYYNNINSVVTIQTEITQYSIFNQINYGQAIGSGFIISEDGYIVTNHHVIEDAKMIKVIMHDGSEYEAELVGSESDNDVAVIRIKSEDDSCKFQPVVLGDSENMLIGEDVVAIGNPLGELAFSMSKGIISALSRTIQVDSETVINMFQVDCAINEGNSGGPILNMYGEVIGIVSAKYASDKIEGLGFCIPINDVKTIVEDIITYGKVVNKAYMGIIVTDMDETSAKRYNMVEGAYIFSIEEDGPAANIGLKQGDIIVELDGKKVTSVSELLLAKRNYRAGDTVTLKIWRSGEYLDYDITFTEYIEDEVKENNSSQYDGLPPYNDSESYSNMDDYLWNYFFNQR